MKMKKKENKEKKFQGGSGGCVQRMEVILKMKKSRGTGRGGGGGVRVDVYIKWKLL